MANNNVAEILAKHGSITPAFLEELMECIEQQPRIVENYRALQRRADNSKDLDALKTGKGKSAELAATLTVALLGVSLLKLRKTCDILIVPAGFADRKSKGNGSDG